MKVALVSPFHRSGLTTVTALMGLALTWTQQVSTTIAYTGESNLPHIIGAPEVDDKTRAITQLSKLLTERAIGPEQITEYCMSLTRDLYLLDTRSNILTTEQKGRISSFVFDQVPTDFVVCECSEDIDDEETQSFLQVADIVVLVFEPYRTQFEGVKECLASEYWPKDKHTMLLCNKYEDIVMPLRNMSAMLGVKHVDMCKLHYNPWIMKMGDANSLADIIDPIVTHDPRVLALNNDIREWMDFFMSLSGTRVKWGV